MDLLTADEIKTVRLINCVLQTLYKDTSWFLLPSRGFRFLQVTVHFGEARSDGTLAACVDLELLSFVQSI